MKRTIGILGGIGPESSALFYERLVSEFKNRFLPQNNTDYPHIIINSIPAPELTSGDNRPKLEYYIDGLKFLERNSDFIVIVCNTAYILFDDFAKSISKPIINLRNLIQRTLKEKTATRVLVLASPNSINEGLFAYPDIHNVELDTRTKNKLGDIINRINLGKHTHKDLLFIRDLIKKHRGGVDIILIACTELSTLLKSFRHPKKIDTLDLLVEATLNYYASIS